MISYAGKLTRSCTATVTGPQRSSLCKNELAPFFFRSCRENNDSMVSPHMGTNMALISTGCVCMRAYDRNVCREGLERYERDTEVGDKGEKDGRKEIKK